MNNIPESTINKWREITNLMIELTDQKKIDWSESTDDDWFLGIYSDVVFDVRKKYSRRDGEPYPIITITLSNDEGEFEKFTDDDITEDGNPYFLKLNSFLTKVKRQVTGADEKTDRLLAQMRRDGEIPF